MDDDGFDGAHGLRPISGLSQRLGLISRNSDTERQGQVLGLNNATSALARVAGPYGAGLVFANLSINGPFWIGSAIVAPAIFLAVSAGRAVKRSQILT